MNVTVIIPSYNPDEKLAEVVSSLVSEGFDDIIVVNDGSDKDKCRYFDEIKTYSQCVILKHDVNKGKGRALKTAFEYCISNRKDIAGVVTVDGDNQHKAADIKKCCECMLEATDSVVLGVRDFSGEDIPARSRWGNDITRMVFRFACGIKISDTQTGLRAIPVQYLSLMCDVDGERYEYETNMLLSFKQRRIGIKEVKISTVYIEDNATSHFKPVRDSIKIYAVIFKFMFSSFTSSVIDIAIFTLVNYVLLGRITDSARIFAATLIARVISSLFNYGFNRKAVFGNAGSVKGTLVRYYILCALQLCCSYGLVYLVTDVLMLNPLLTVIAKIVIDTLLFLVSFQIQRIWVFKK